MDDQGSKPPDSAINEHKRLEARQSGQVSCGDGSRSMLPKFDNDRLARDKEV
jgi:hypothetical protein